MDVNSSILFRWWQAGLLAAVMTCGVIAHAGVHSSEERLVELPSSWKGFLADHRALRLIALPPSPQMPPSALRQQYSATADRLLHASKSRPLTANEAADLGAAYIRLNKLDAALAVLRDAVQKHPRHFKLHANLGAAWHQSGDLPQALEHLRQAVQLAPPELRPAEELHLLLVRHRLRRGKDAGLDDLFAIRFTDALGQHRLGQLTADDRARLPANAVALVQQLALWMPHDGRLLWQLAELAACHGDLTTATILLDLCVGEFALADPDLRKARQALQAALATRGPLPIGKDAQQQAHTTHAGLPLTFKSRRPLIQRPLDIRHLPPVVKGQTHLVTWPLLAETATDTRRFKPTYHPYLQKLEGEKITLTGFLQPLTDDLECTTFLLVENPLGCWFCELPDLTGIVFVALPPGATARFTRHLIKVTGILKLNSTDPEDFLISISDAKIAAVE
jgi:hypothetical protein